MISVMTTANDEIRPFRVEILQESLDDLRGRLNRVRWASEVPGPAPEGYDVSLAWVRRLTEYCRDSYDWRTAEARLNSYPQFATEIDGQDVQFLHVKSPEPGALPLILTHGGPGSVVEFLNVIGPLTDPRAYGKDPAAAFDLVVSSLTAHPRDIIPPSIGFLPQMSQYFAGLRGDRSPNLIAVEANSA